MVVRMRSTRSHTGNRRSHDFLKQGSLSKCSECGQPKLNHRICPNCGKYKGRVVVDVLAKVSRKDKKAKAKAKENK